MPIRTETNVVTGEKRVIELTPEEVADAAVQKAADDIVQAARKVLLDRKIARRVLLDRFLDRLETDPTIIDRVR